MPLTGQAKTDYMREYMRAYRYSKRNNSVKTALRPTPLDPIRPNPSDPIRPDLLDPLRPNPLDPIRPDPLDPNSLRPEPSHSQVGNVYFDNDFGV